MDPDHLAALWQTEDPVVGGGSAPSAPQTSAEQRRVFFSLLLASSKAHSTNAGRVCGLERGLAAKPTGTPRCHGGGQGDVCFCSLVRSCVGGGMSQEVVITRPFRWWTSESPAALLR